MKRHDLIRELERAGCHLLRHGGRHDIFINPSNGRRAPVPRHQEIPKSLCRLIKRQLGLLGEDDQPE
jgi:mRNA interferase HicA